ncbi:DNA adenine methylase [Corynebacterium coyleae]|uniref:Site-specific DNA-methyltransferase (adenine-specific) n=1 Tax=Corynebacterium coyleae TaxID=53374 RepID=A0ABX8KVE1_9CORY|nr:Dam family site-specific DNA-(adenine-N6)-methyltransferase [Corynebacterium coyleae]QXB17758.1 Dam family site-specific DNA-(adenine-N6)-methyltransferase [Corynebacterium coyleae]WJY79164.1 Modification methylase DpnIIA [Corynebacterium coyleae]SEB69450.1 DNA adenine methylase [Corynebacterium coyleae]
MSANGEISTRVKPLVRWAGGKSRLLSKILPAVPSAIQDYYEPFLGGGAVYLTLYKRVEGCAYLSDVNPHLIAGWRGYANPTDRFLATLSNFEKQDSEEFYYEMRSQSPTDPFDMAARFAYLNATSWNHLWRENSKTGAMNAPWGKRAFKMPSNERLAEFKNAVKGASISVQDFRVALQSAQAGDFVYLDPPYLPIWTNQEEKEPTSKFNRYNAKTFELPDLEDLADCCRDLDQKGVAWLLSNRDTEQVRELFSFAKIQTFTTTRSVAAQSKRSVESRKSPEVLILGANLGI